jgi:hypothetical protein
LNTASIMNIVSLHDQFDSEKPRDGYNTWHGRQLKKTNILNNFMVSLQKVLSKTFLLNRGYTSAMYLDGMAIFEIETAYVFV